MGLLCLTALCGSRLPDRHLLNSAGHTAREEGLIRKRILSIAAGELGVRELSGRNDGKRVEEYLNAIQLGKGHAWCGAYVSWVFMQAGFDQPRIGWTPSLFPFRRLTRLPLSGDVFGIYFPALKRIAHAGLVEQLDSDWVLTLEGNTNIKGSRDGDGVFRKRRHKRTIKSYANWIKKENS